MRSRRRLDLKPLDIAEKYIGENKDPDGFQIIDIDKVIGINFFFQIRDISIHVATLNINMTI